jgi:hypothetical protein
MFHDTYLQTLTGIFTQSLSAFTTPEWQNLRQNLSSFTHTVTSLEQTVEQCLSSIPTHPYERLKYEYFGPDYKFKCLDDIEEPEKVPYERCMEFIKQKNNELMSTTFHNLTCNEEDTICTGFSFLSGDKFLPDYTRQKKYIEFLEMTRNIPLNSITDENYLSIAKKLITEYVRVL